ncbi:hypothetical protein BGZ79_011059, partial [Entomortierella chlamydospora]
MDAPAVEDGLVNGKSDNLLSPWPINDFITDTRSKLSSEDHEHFFTQMLADIDAPVLPYGLSETRHGGFDVKESRVVLRQDLNRRLRDHAQRMEVSLASLFHLAWAQVISRVSGQEQVVFGTAFSGCTQGKPESDQAKRTFINNTLPIRIDVGGSSVDESVHRTQDDLTALLGHESASLALAERCSGVPIGNALFNSSLNYRFNFKKSNETKQDINDMENNWRELTRYPFVISVEEREDSFGLTAQIATQFDPNRICGYMQQTLLSLVDALDHKPNMQVRNLEIIPDEEREMLLQSWNATDAAYPDHSYIHRMFEKQVSRSPEDVAIVFEDRKVSYVELNARANGIAHRLRNLGVKPDTLVAICMERSPEMVIGLLAIMKAGGAYVPIDPAYPGERLRLILSDAAPAVLLADSVGRTALGEPAIASLPVIDLSGTQESSDSNLCLDDLTPQHLAYVIYTSGSTGTPKGVMITHSGACNYLHWSLGTYAPKRGAVVSSSISFDATVTSLWTPLLCGSTVTLLKSGNDDLSMRNLLLIHSIEIYSKTNEFELPTVFINVGNEVESLEDYVRTQGEGLLKITPAHLDMMGRRLMADGVKTKIDTFVIGGEALNPSTVELWRNIQPDVRLVNEYGPTETVVGCSVYEMITQLKQSTNVPIGRPIANTRLYVLDSHRQPVPLGAIGELYIGGSGVARGYLNRPDLTAERFLPDPFSDVKGGRMFKSGDLARYLPDGNLLFLGRNDDQVKIRGYRIELGEIEAQLSEHALVRETAVIALGEGANKRLVAYIVAEPTDGLVLALRSHLSSKLPEYMIPAAFVRLNELPLTPNGKLDRLALPDPGIDSFVSREYEPPQNGIESTLAEIWSELLDIGRIGRHDNFFMLGGHSLLAVQMIERLRRIGLEISIRILFSTPTLSALAQSIDKNRIIMEAPKNLITLDTTRITPELLPLVDFTQDDIDLIVNQVESGVTNIQDIYALSPLQDGILFHHIMATKGDPYLLAKRMSFDNKDNLDHYLDAVQKVVDRHDVLRTAIMWENLSVPAQVVLRHVTLPITELSLDPMDGTIVDQIMRLTDPREHRLNLTQAPLIRFIVAQDTDGSWILVELFHHIVGDHSTSEFMANEIKAFHEGCGETLPQPQPFRNLISHIRSGPGIEVQQPFFTKMLADIDTPALPYGLSDVHRDGVDVAESHLILSQDLNNRLRGHAKRMGVSLASLCHLAWAQVVSRTSGNERVVFGTVLFGRMQGGSGSDQAMGLFMNTLPIRIDVGGISVEESVRRTQADLAALLEHEHAPLALAQRCSSIPSGTPLFSSLLNFLHNTVQSSETSDIQGMKVIDFQERTNYPFSVSVEDGGDTLGLIAQVVKQFDSARICEYMQQALLSLVDALENMPRMQVRDLEIVSTVERELLLQSWNATDAAYPDHSYIHRMFEKQVSRSPEDVAIVFEDRKVSYVELNARANGIAHRLRNLGVKPDTLVAICMERSPEMVIGLLAIMKAGGAYVPIDPAYPGERLRLILSDAAPAVLLADSVGRTALGEPAIASLPVIDLSGTQESSDSNLCLDDLTPQHLAYVIYTSGSTGTPKGVMITHSGACNYLHWSLGTYAPKRGAVVSSSISFDATVTSLWTPLLCGSTVTLLKSGNDDLSMRNLLLIHSIEIYSKTNEFELPTVFINVGNEVESLEDYVRTQGEGLLKITPAHLDMMGRRLMADGVKTKIDTFVIGGEALNPSTVELWRNIQPDVRLVNEYGPTETVVGCSVYEMITQLKQSTNVPIGRPIANTRLYVLDSHRQPVPLGAIGELYIGGSGVARGYLNRPDLTAERFIPDPFSDVKGGRMFKSGDLARYLPDGNLLFLGRNDDQVKIRGYRIELGEIEAQLSEHALVRETAVIALGEGANKRLVAYIVAEPTDGLVLALRSHLSSKLPEYMIPAAFVRLNELPLTPNGKLDRLALPDPGIDSFVSREYEPPQNGIESTLAEIWSELLDIGRIGRHDNFFMLGGHSLLAVQMIERLRRVGLNISIRALFDKPTLSALAQSIDRSQAIIEAPKNLITLDTTRITPELLPLIDLTQDDIDLIVNQVDGGVSNIQDIYALSPLQDGILFHHIMAAKGDPYLIATKMSFDKRVILDNYLGAVQKVVDRHDVLRTAIMWENLSMPAQVVLRHAALSITELSLDPLNGPVTDQITRLTDPQEYRIDLTQAPLIRFVIAQDTDGSWIVVQLLHHLIGDNSSMDTMSSEIQAFMKEEGKLLQFKTNIIDN